MRNFMVVVVVVVLLWVRFLTGCIFLCRLRHDCEQRCWGWSSCLCSISTSRWSRWLGKILQSTSLHTGFSSTIWIGHWCCQKQSKLSQAWVPSCQHGTFQKSIWPSKSNSSMLLERAPLKRCNDLIWHCVLYIGSCRRCRLSFQIVVGTILSKDRHQFCFAWRVGTWLFPT